MVQIRRARAAVTTHSARWVGGGAVALLHLLFLLALLLTDKLSLHKAVNTRSMIVYDVPDDPAKRQAPTALDLPSRLTSLPSIAVPHLDGPMILVRPDQPQQPPSLPLMLDLSVHDTSKDPNRKRTLEELGPPSKEQQLKQFFKESAEDARHAREKSAGEDCETMMAKDRDLGSDSPFKDPLPMETVCSPRASAKELSRRNDRFSPH